MQEGTTFEGARGLSVGDSTVVWRSFTNTTATNVWVDFYARIPDWAPSAGDPVLTNSVAGAFYITDTGFIRAISNDTWVTLNYKMPSNTWQRFSVNLDYIASNWAIYVADDVPNALSSNVVSGLKFSSSSTNQYFHTFRVRN